MDETKFVSMTNVKKILENRNIPLSDFIDRIKQGKFTTYAKDPISGQMRLFKVTSIEKGIVNGYFLDG